MGSRKRLRARIADIRARNPAALPAWLRDGPREQAWYRASWQNDGGVSPDDAARPAVVALQWLAEHGLLTASGYGALRSAHRGDLASVPLSRSMVTPRGATFLDRFWNQWWEQFGINLAISPDMTPTALAGLDQFWTTFGQTTTGRIDLP